jgi:hypothetical protein
MPTMSAIPLCAVSFDAYPPLAFAVVVSLYVVKAVALGRCRLHVTAFVVFLGALAVAVPFTWLISPYQGDRGVFPQAIYIGEPLSTLLIPCLSFLWDWMCPQALWPRRFWLWRVPLELPVAVLWFIFWEAFQLFVLEWTYI